MSYKLVQVHAIMQTIAVITAAHFLTENGWLKLQSLAPSA
jgi:hypothetical protein